MGNAPIERMIKDGTGLGVGRGPGLFPDFETLDQYGLRTFSNPNKLKKKLENAYQQPEIKDSGPILQRFQLGGFVNQKVFANDTRVELKNNSSYPFSAIGLVELKDAETGEQYHGTGFLISRSIVLTCAHNLVCREKKKPYIDIRFIPGYYQGHTPFGTCNACAIYYPASYLDCEEEDYGLIVLDSPVGDYAGYFGLQMWMEGIVDKPQEVYLWGYPGDKKGKLYGDQGQVSKWDGGFLHYKINTYGGNSGSPVFVKDVETRNGVKTEVYFAIGIHVLGFTNDVKPEDMFNKAVWITRSRYFDIQHPKLPGRLLPQKNPKGKAIGINYKDFGDSGVDVLLKTDQPDLTVLDLIQARISDKGVLAIVEKSTWKNLHTLSLTENHIGNEGAIALASHNDWKFLQVLRLAKNRIGCPGVSALAKNLSWTYLQTLFLYNNRIRDEGAAALAENSCWSFLNWFDLEKNFITEEGVRALRSNKV